VLRDQSTRFGKINRRLKLQLRQVYVRMTSPTLQCESKSNSKAGVSKLRPAGQIRSAQPFFQ